MINGMVRDAVKPVSLNIQQQELVIKKISQKIDELHMPAT
jgi:hypothetical protein